MPQPKKCGCGFIFTSLFNSRGEKEHVPTSIDFCPLHEQAEKMLELISDMDYVLTNVWAPDYKKFHDQFSPRCKEILAAQRKDNP